MILTQQAPPAPAPPPAAAAGVPGVINPLSDAPLGREEVAALRNARSELSRQLTSASDRRNELMEQLKSAPAEGRAGLQQRIDLLDQRLLQLEGDIQAVGRKLALAPREFSETRPAEMPPGFAGGPQFNPGVLVPILAIFFAGTIGLRMIWNRGRPAPTVPMSNPDVDARLERLEQAVDAVAIEVERIGESQRYQAKLLGEGAVPFNGVGQPAMAREPIPRGQAQGG